MRLLHATELRFEEFFDVVPDYAILSHRWGPDEVSYHDFLAGSKKGGAGYKKILDFCNYAAMETLLHEGHSLKREWLKKPQKSYTWSEFAADDWVWVEPLRWVWIDTCCIDKTSSAELSEAINSTFDWYKESHVCYAYLSDVTKSESMDQTLQKFRGSKWFSRGWTLQELLSPRSLVFLDKWWTELGIRNDLVSDVAKATGIAKNQVAEFSRNMILDTTVAEKFSFAASRKTTRSEDRAYCLMGLFGINMPLLYGERSKAFKRLQIEIIRSSNDESIFVWGIFSIPFSFFGSVLPTEAGDYDFGQNIQPMEFQKINGLERPPYSITNQGLELHVPKNLSRKSDFLLPLNCQHYVRATLMGVYAIRLVRDKMSSIWRRNSSPTWSDHLPKLGVTVHQVTSWDSFFTGLYIVPIEWVWSRADLAKGGSETIYATIND